MIDQLPYNRGLPFNQSSLFIYSETERFLATGKKLESVSPQPTNQSVYS